LRQTARVLEMFVAYFGGFLLLVALVVWAGVDLVRGRHRYPVALVKLSTAGLLVLVGRVSALLAERRTGWSDEDADGMLDGFANGGYDWVDLNGEQSARYALALGTPVLLAACVACLLLARRPRRT
jgi:hypothetical protein